MDFSNPKITSNHLDRKAIVYLRQSSLAQVRNNLESQRLQYALADRARDLGWQEIEVIDTDLGASASMSSARAGFEHLVSKVALGQVGIVMAREASRWFSFTWCGSQADGFKADGLRPTIFLGSRSAFFTFHDDTDAPGRRRDRLRRPLRGFVP